MDARPVTGSKPLGAWGTHPHDDLLEGENTIYSPPPSYMEKDAVKKLFNYTHLLKSNPRKYESLKVEDQPSVAASGAGAAAPLMSAGTAIDQGPPALHMRPPPGDAPALAPPRPAASQVYQALRVDGQHQVVPTSRHSCPPSPATRPRAAPSAKAPAGPRVDKAPPQPSPADGQKGPSWLGSLFQSPPLAVMPPAALPEDQLAPPPSGPPTFQDTAQEQLNPSKEQLGRRRSSWLDGLSGLFSSHPQPPPREAGAGVGPEPEDQQGNVPVLVKPEPRRLFGVGPLFQPPAETVYASKQPVAGQQPGGGGGSLTERVQQEGITTKRKASNFDLNALSPSSM